MKTTWKTMAAGLAVLIGLSGAAFGQNRGHGAPDRGRPAMAARGWNGGHEFRPAPGRVPDRAVRVPDHDEGWYRARHIPVPVYGGGIYLGPGYSAPYYGYYPGYAYGPVAYAGGSAQSIGYQDGFADGQNDRLAGLGFQPTLDSNYRFAEDGYSPAFGGLLAYQGPYRLGYEQGYAQGYGA